VCNNNLFRIVVTGLAIVFQTTFLFSQITGDSVEFYFVKILNEYRKTLHDGIKDVTVNKMASLGCEHHNNYLFNMVWVNKTPGNDKFILSHQENPLETIGIDVFKYVGKDTLISNFADRIIFYNTNKDFAPNAEVIASGSYFLDGITNEYIAKKLFMSFMKSKPHKEQLDRNDYHSLAIDCRVELDKVFADASIVVVTGGNGIKFGNYQTFKN
jgi:hypothetical protein